MNVIGKILGSLGSSDYVRGSEAFEEEENEHPTMGSQTRTPEMLHNL